MTTDPEITYYRFERPAEFAPPPAGSELYGFEYRDFLVTRVDNQFLLWQIKMKDESKPPLELRGSFTNRARAMSQIDDFLQNEWRAQQEAEAKAAEKKKPK